MIMAVAVAWKTPSDNHQPSTFNPPKMKTKVTLFIAAAAVVTLSFTYATTSRVDKKPVAVAKASDRSAPAGGFAIDEK